MKRRYGTAAKALSLARDTRGATAIEFALLAPIFFAILTAILETAVLLFAGQVLESGVQDISRSVRVGEAQRELWTVEDYKESICSRLFGLFGDCPNMHVKVTEVDDFTSADLTLPLDPDCEENCDWTEPEVFAPGIASSVVLVQVYYRYPSLLQLPFSPYRLADGNSLLSAATVFRNEPF